MDIKKLAKRVKSLRVQKLKEQGTPEEYKKQLKNLQDIGNEPHAATSPNKAHIEEGRSMTGHKRSFGGSYSNRATNPAKRNLGNLKSRFGSQNANTQQGRRKYTAEEATEIAIEKVKNKKGKMAKNQGGQTDTGKNADTVEVTPTKVELTTNH